MVHPEKTLADLIAYLHEYPFPEDLLAKEGAKENYSEAKLREVVKRMTQKIFNYLKRTHDEKVFGLIEPKLEVSGVFEYIRQGTIKELIDPKTLKNCLVKRKASEATQNVLEAFRVAAEEEKKKWKHLNRLVGDYNLYNLHTSHNFQISNIHIGKDEEGDDTHLYYMSPTFSPDRKKLQFEVIGGDKVLLSLKEENFYLTFYGFVGGINRPNFFQTVFFYNSDRRATIGSIAVFERVDGEQVVKEKIGRELVALPPAKESIQRFLINRSRILTPPSLPFANPREFLEARAVLKPGPFHTRATFYQDKFVGVYDIFFSERFVSADEFQRTGFFSSVSRGSLCIYKDPKSGVLNCAMRTLKNSQGEILEHRGYVLNNQLNSSSYLILSLYLEPHKDRYLNLIFNIINDNFLIGSHNIMYSPPTQLGAGVSIMNRLRDTEASPDNLPLPTTVNPLAPGDVTGSERFIINFLSNIQSASIFPPAFQKLSDFKDLKYTGLYKVYSQGSEGAVKISALRIYSNGYVIHKGSPKSDHALDYGIASVKRSVVSITLINAGNERKGVFNIKFDNIAPGRSKKEINFYGGTFSGVTRESGEIPLASILFLEFMGREGTVDDIPVNLITRDTESFQDESLIPAPIRKVISQRTNATLILARDIYQLKDIEEYGKKLEDWKDIFFHAAIGKAMFQFTEDEEGDWSKLLNLAESHGKEDVKKEAVMVRNKLGESHFERAIYHSFVAGNRKKGNEFLEKAKSVTPWKDWDKEYKKYEAKSADYDRQFSGME